MFFFIVWQILKENKNERKKKITLQVNSILNIRWTYFPGIFKVLQNNEDFCFISDTVVWLVDTRKENLLR